MHSAVHESSKFRTFYAFDPFTIKAAFCKGCKLSLLSFTRESFY